MLIEHAVIQSRSSLPQRPVQGSQISDPAMRRIQRFTADGRFNPEGMAMDTPVGTPLRLTRKVVGRVEGCGLGNLENAHLTPIYLWVWTLSRHFGWVRQYSMAAAVLATRSGPSIG